METIDDLDTALMAGLTLIQGYQGRLTSDDAEGEASQAVARVMDVQLPRVLRLLKQLKGTFVHLSTDSRRDTKLAFTSILH